MSDPINNTRKAYIAGIGMITSVGADTDMTAIAIKAEYSGYRSGDFFNQQRQPMTLSPLPRALFDEVDIHIDEGAYYGAQYDHIIKMAFVALSEALRTAVSRQFITAPVPLILALPEESVKKNYIPIDLLTRNLLNQSSLHLKPEWIHGLSTGRAAGIQGINLALRALYEQGHDYVLLGGSDSYLDDPRLDQLDKDERVLAPNRTDGFAPGEGAGFLLLTRHPGQALSHNGNIIGLSPPGMGEEPGNLHDDSDQPYHGDGLDQAFKGALTDNHGNNIHTVYTSMNGEHYWAKECAVAMLRNEAHLQEKITVAHPADCYGDLGTATGPVLIGLAAYELLKTDPGPASHLVYSASDGPARAAVRVEKIDARSIATQ